MNLKDTLTKRFVSRLLATREGRRHVLDQSADAEGNGEAAVFERALEKVDDAELRRLIKIHRDDEIRHAEMFRACSERTGVWLPPPPRGLGVVDRLDRALGGKLDQPIRDGRGVMEAYLMLLVIEERAIEQFAMLGPFFQVHDRWTAEAIAEIARDEERHLKYCRAIARRYAPDEATLDATLHRYRALEARVYAEHTRANMRHTLESGYLDVGPAEKLFWLGVLAISAQVQPDQKTSRWGQPAGARGPRDLAQAA